MATAYLNQSNFNKALEYFLKSLEIAEKYKLLTNIAPASYNVARTFNMIGNNQKALQYSLVAKKIYSQCKMYNEEGNASCLIGGIFIDMNMLDSAEKYLHHALKSAKKYNELPRERTALSNLAIIYSEKKDFKKAIEYLEQSNSTEYFPPNIANNLGNLASYLNEAKEYEKAISTALKGIDTCNKYNLSQAKQYIYAQLSTSYQRTNRYKAALEYYKLSCTIKDSLFSEENIKKLNELNIQYETEKNKIKINELKKEQEYHSLIQNILILGISGLVIFLVFTIYLYVNKKTLAQILTTTNKDLKTANEEINKQKSVLEHKEELLTASNSELTSTNKYLEELNFNLERLNNDKNEFLRIAAHDLKNPLSNIAMGTYTIKKHFDLMKPEKLFQIIDNIESTSIRMKDIVSNLLDVDLIESGAYNLNYEPIDAAHFVYEIIDEYKLAASKKNIELIIERIEDPIIIEYDKNTLHEILDNLLSNAIKFSPKYKSIFISLFLNDKENLVFSIRDQGPGLSDEDKNKLFKKYSKLSARPTGGVNSTGLGLSIVKKLAELLNSTVICDSVLGDGATFSLVIPKSKIIKLGANERII
jgi:signal transduction histidine kinase